MLSINSMLFFMILLGAIIGSFLNVLIHRLPNNQSIIFPSSHCIYCKVSIPWYYNIPIISFLVLKGYSSCCNKPISIRYLAVEIISTLLWVWSYYYLIGFINQLLFLCIASCLLVIFFTDYSHFFIPIELTSIIFITSLCIFFINDVDSIEYQFFSMFLLSFYFLILMLVSSFLMKKDTMGYGDIILIAVVTFWMGLFDGLLIIFFASLFSITHWLFLKIVTKNEHIVLPFGSTISLATILIFIIKTTLQLETSFF